MISFVEYLGSYLTEERKHRIAEVLSQRTQHLAVVLEDIHHAHNASAIMRTCDCFGVQDMYVVEGESQFKTNKYIVRGSSNWVDLHMYESGQLDTCVTHLKEKGYKIVATTPHTDKSVFDLNLGHKLAFCFGSEKNGISKDLINQADELVKIPMYGFTESFNISVSVALILGHFVENMKVENIDWKLSKDKYEELIELWYLQSLKNGDFYKGEYAKFAEQN